MNSLADCLQGLIDGIEAEREQKIKDLFTKRRQEALKGPKKEYVDIESLKGSTTYNSKQAYHVEPKFKYNMVGQLVPNPSYKPSPRPESKYFGMMKRKITY